MGSYPNFEKWWDVALGPGGWEEVVNLAWSETEESQGRTGHLFRPEYPDDYCPAAGDDDE